MTQSQAPAGRSILRRAIHGRGQHGFTLFELIVMISLVCVISAVSLESILRYEEYVEKNVMDITVRNMRSGLRLRVADLLMQDRMGEAGKLLNENPITWLETPPPNYVGELQTPISTAGPSGSWYFDSGRKELVYLPKHQQFFKPGPGGEKRIRYRVTAVTHPLGRSAGNDAKVEGLTLSLLHTYQWNVQLSH